MNPFEPKGEQVRTSFVTCSKGRVLIYLMAEKEETWMGVIIRKALNEYMEKYHPSMVKNDD